MINTIQISENCWKHIDKYDTIFYTNTPDPDSELHRENGPALEWLDGTKEWRINGKLHREDGPAIELKCRKEWWINGKLHRVGNPAVEYSIGETYWYYKNTYIPFKDNLKLLKKK